MSGPTYTYTQNTPQAANPMNTTASTIQNNFLAIQELLQVNHASWSDTNAATNLGNHNFISMPNQSTLPGTLSTEVAMFTQVTGSPNPCEIFVQSANNGSLTQISNSSTPSGGSTIPSGTSGTGWCQFSSGLIMKWGNSTVTIAANTGNNATYFAFPSGPLFTKTAFWAQVTLTNNPSGNNYGGFAAFLFYGSVGSPNRQGMNMQGISGGTYTFNWFVIGF